MSLSDSPQDLHDPLNHHPCPKKATHKSHPHLTRNKPTLLSTCDPAAAATAVANTAAAVAAAAAEDKHCQALPSTAFPSLLCSPAQYSQVVLNHEDVWQLVESCHVEGLIELAHIAGAVSEEGAGDRVG